MAVTGYRREVTGSSPVSLHARFLFHSPRLYVPAQTEKGLTDKSNHEIIGERERKLASEKSGVKRTQTQMYSGFEPFSRAKSFADQYSRGFQRFRILYYTRKTGWQIRLAFSGVLARAMTGFERVALAETPPR